MEIDRLSRYERDVKKMVKKRKLTQKEIDDTEILFLKDKYIKSLRYHPITCKKDKQRHSLTIPNTQYRILFSAKLFETQRFKIGIKNSKTESKRV